MNGKSSSKNNKNLKHNNTRGVGAPKKEIRFPQGAKGFTVKQCYDLNNPKGSKEQKVCMLTIRQRIEEGVKSKALVAGEDLPQSNGGVGRPQARYVVAAVLKAQKPVKKAPARKPATKTAVTVTTVGTPSAPTAPVAGNTPSAPVTAPEATTAAV